ncbi:hypothetical protein B0T11DRAFT_358627 [Plectosphaerella cucumerina]|uniref:Uncharacterized protein n=1 Tax=Plectosphaerella cucumerina TaxID=40658 RepID=A0A8K0T612_9PEZI|nr:hypothetical protein B0T11DRAFT_358627 [Plectosphaerella cucumerina]
MPQSPTLPPSPSSSPPRRPLPESNLPPSLTHASLPLPTPSLTLDFRIAVDLNPLLPVGTHPGPFGQRNWISFSGGTFAATWATGTVVSGGQDSQLVIPSDLSTAVETAYLLQTNDEPPAHIAVRTRGWRSGPREVMERLFDPERASTVAPNEYKFHLSVSLETGDPRYSALLNTGLWVGSGARLGRAVVYDAYRVV